MRQTGESERESGGNNDAERERTSESEIEDLGARLDKACASRPLDRAQHGMTRRTAATHLLTAVLWLATAVILLAMLLRMPLYMILICFTLIASSMSVIIQRVYFKVTHGKRIFKMSPIHHHFELSGMTEVQIVAMYAVVVGMLSLIALFSLNVLP